MVVNIKFVLFAITLIIIKIGVIKMIIKMESMFCKVLELICSKQFPGIQLYLSFNTKKDEKEERKPPGSL